MAALNELSSHSKMACTAGCCDPCNEKALRASRGAAFKLHLAHGDWEVRRQLLLDQHPHMQCTITSSNAIYAMRVQWDIGCCCSDSSYCDGLQGLDEAVQCHSLTYVGAEPHEEAQSTAESSSGSNGMPMCAVTPHTRALRYSHILLCLWRQGHCIEEETVNCKQLNDSFAFECLWLSDTETS